MPYDVNLSFYFSRPNRYHVHAWNTTYTSRALPTDSWPGSHYLYILSRVAEMHHLSMLMLKVSIEC